MPLVDKVKRPERRGRRWVPARQTARRTNMSLILVIALVGLRPLGQTSPQFMIVWHTE